MGLPTITTTQNGAHEIMAEDRHGYVLTDPSDADALAERMRRMLDDGRRGAMARACLELRPALSYARHLDTLEELYDQNIRRRRSAQPATAAG